MNNNSKAFPHLDEMIHLNHAAVAPWPRCSQVAVSQFAEENMRQGSLNYMSWLKVERTLRSNVAKLINAHTLNDIALVKNTSEGLSFVAYGLDWNDGDNIVSSNQEFPSNRIVWESLGRFGVEFREADLDAGPTPEDSLLSLVDEHTRLITISSIQYASGTRMDLERIGTFCRERGILFCVDAIQSIGATQFDVAAIKADFVMADGHKWMLGPEGLGIFWVRPEIRDQLKLTQYGWHMVDPLGDYTTKEWQVTPTARRFECGSPNMISIHALNASINLLLETGMDTVEAQLLENSRFLFEQLSSIGKVEILNNQDEGRFGGIVTFRPLQADKLDGLFLHLNDNKVFCAQRGGGIRFSPHFYTPHEQLTQAISLVDSYLS
ncbi:aminotransferase class V-fold PLP-dependent enzyme [Pseudomonadota bacterium]